MNLSPSCREVFGKSFTNTFIMYFISLLYIETADRPGLLVEIMKIIADVNIDVESAEIDTEVFFLVFLSLILSAFSHTSIVPGSQFCILTVFQFSSVFQQGLVAKDKFHVSYGGAALNRSLSQVIVYESKL